MNRIAIMSAVPALMLSACAASPVPPSVHRAANGTAQVSYADIDLDAPGGMDKLRERVAIAADLVCEASHRADLYAPHLKRPCINRILAGFEKDAAARGLATRQPALQAALAATPAP